MPGIPDNIKLLEELERGQSLPEMLEESRSVLIGETAVPPDPLCCKLTVCIPL